jgi:uncharacterized membrane protein
MSLPAITIPVEIPFQVPLLLHPVAVHFAIAIPIIVLILELFNLYFKRRALNVITVSFLLVLIVIYAGLYITGTTDGSEAFPLLTDAGKDELKEHKLLGIYLVYASLLPVIFKSISLLVMNKWAKIIYLVVLLLFIGVNLKQGKDGGELVYEHGANVAAIADSKEKLEEMKFEIEDLTESVTEYEEEVEALQEELDELKAAGGSATSAMDAVEASSEDMEAEADQVVEGVQESAETLTEQAEEVIDAHTPAAE